LDTKGYYAIMGVSEQASYREIRAAFRRLAKKYHPDLNGSLNAEETIKKINAAFEVLSDKEKRRQYDIMCFDDSNTIQKQYGQHKENHNYSQSPTKSEDKNSSDAKDAYRNRNFYSGLNNDTDNDKDEDYYSGRNVKSQSSTVTTDTSNTRNRFQIIVEPSLCMAFGSCETLAPKVFVVEKDKIFNPKAKVISEVGEDFDTILAAAQTCPTKAILIIDRNTGEYIYP
jgi:DnaJ-class molecular chaperone